MLSRRKKQDVECLKGSEGPPYSSSTGFVLVLRNLQVETSYVRVVQSLEGAIDYKPSEREYAFL